MNINIYEIRGYRVMLDEDLAKIYGVETKVLNQAVKRNIDRFPEEFMFQLTKEEQDYLRSQIVTSNDSGKGIIPLYMRDSLKSQIVTSNDEEHDNLRSHIVISSRGGRRKKPFAFTEHGAVMLASILRSEQAVKMSIEVVKAFVNLRRTITSHENMGKQISDIKSFMLKQSNKTDRDFRKVWNAIEKLSKPSEGGQIGFCIDEE